VAPPQRGQLVSPFGGGCAPAGQIGGPPALVSYASAGSVGTTQSPGVPSSASSIETATGR
jgi:hypothetical protein